MKINFRCQYIPGAGKWSAYTHFNVCQVGSTPKKAITLLKKLIKNIMAFTGNDKIEFVDDSDKD